MVTSAPLLRTSTMMWGEAAGLGDEDVSSFALLWTRMNDFARRNFRIAHAPDVAGEQ